MIQNETSNLLQPILYALLLHILIAIGFLVGLPQLNQDEEIHVPRYIKANLLTMKPSQDKPVEQVVKPKPKPEVKVAEVKKPEVKVAAAKPVEKAKVEPVKKEQERAQVEKVVVQTVKPVQKNDNKIVLDEVVKPVEQPTVQNTEVAIIEEPVIDTVAAELDMLAMLEDEIRQQEIDEQVRAEQEQAINAQNVADGEAISNYKDQIALEVEKRWSRPQNASADMQVKLTIRLLPTGELNSVTIVESSGNALFDRSAEVAVKKVSRFPVPTDIRLFNKGGFRQFNFIFKPKDL